jgi:hypothetical protein
MVYSINATTPHKKSSLSNSTNVTATSTCLRKIYFRMDRDPTHSVLLCHFSHLKTVNAFGK